MKKKVLYIGNFNLPSGSASAQRVNVNKKIIEQAGFEVIFISTFQNSYSMEDESNSININYISEKKMLIEISYIKDAIRSIGEDSIHSVIFYNFPSIALYRANKMLAEMDIKSFADCTEWFGIPQKGSIFYKVTKFLDTEFRMRIVHKQLDGIICISTYLENYYKKNNKTLLLPNTIDIEDSKWVNKKQENDKNEIKFIYAGNPGKYFEKESLDLIVEVISSTSPSFKKIILEIIGITEQEFREIYYEKYGESPVLNNIVFYGRKDHLEVISIVQNSHYFIFLRPKTKANIAGFPTKLVESFGALTPVISNAIGDIPLYIENEVNGYIIEELKEENVKLKIFKIIENHKIHSELKNELKKNNPFNYKNYVKSFTEFIN